MLQVDHSGSQLNLPLGARTNFVAMLGGMWTVFFGSYKISVMLLIGTGGQQAPSSPPARVQVLASMNWRVTPIQETGSRQVPC